MPYLTYGRLRPLHVNGMLFGWLLAADMGLAFYIVPRLCGVKLWSEKLGVATAALWNVIILGAVVCLLAGYNQGLEYAELPLPLDVLVVVAWIMFGVNIFVHHRHAQVHADVRLASGTSWARILWTAFVYLTGNFAIAVHHRRQPGQPQLDVRAQRGRPDLHAGRPGASPTTSFRKSSNTPLHSHKLSMIGFWSLALRLRLDRRAPHAPRADLAVAADHRHRLLA